MCVWVLVTGLYTLRFVHFSVCYTSIKQFLEIKECREVVFPHCVWKIILVVLALLTFNIFPSLRFHLDTFGQYFIPRNL